MKNLSVKETIEKIINFIEDNIKEQIRLEDISVDACISKFHLHRLFTYATNKPLMKYVRSRKLVSSLNELLVSDLKIIDIAQEYAFNNEQNYIRSFRNEFGITPSKYRKGNHEISVQEKIDLNEYYDIASGAIMKPFFVSRPEFYVVGVNHNLSFRDDVLDKDMPNKAGNDFYINQKSKIKNTLNPNMYYGITVEPSFDSDLVTYMCSLEVPGLGQIPEGMSARMLPASQYAVFKYIGFFHPSKLTFHDFKHIWEFIYTAWLPASNYIKKQNFHFERIDTNIASEEYCEMDLYLPVVEKRQEEHQGCL